MFNSYNVALFVHIAAVVALFSATALLLAGLGGARSARSTAALSEWLRLAFVGERLLPPFALIVFLAGARMVGERWQWNRAWVDGALLGLLITAALDELLVKPRLQRARRAVESQSEGPVPADVRAGLHDPALWLGGQLVTTMPTGVLALMVFKPGGLVTGAILAGAAALGGAATAPAVLRYRRLDRGALD